jgi:hypothetical protein
METSLRPLTLGEILDRTAELYRTNFVLFAGIFVPWAGVDLLLNLLLLGMSEWMKALHMDRYVLLVTLATSLVELLVIVLLLGVTIAAISRAVAWVHLGQPATIRGAYGAVLPRIGSYLWLMTITAFVVWTPFALLYASFIGVVGFYGKVFTAQPGVPPAPADPQSTVIIGIAAVVFLLLLIPVGIYTTLMNLRYALALPACVVENTRAGPSLRRAIDLSTGARGRIFILALLVGVIKIGLVGITQIFTILGVVKNHGQISPGLNAVSQVIAFFTNAFLGPIYATGITLLYYDQRVRKEGFDIEWMMQAAGMIASTPELAAGSAVPPPAQEPQAHVGPTFASEPPAPAPPSPQPGPPSQPQDPGPHHE